MAPLIKFVNKLSSFEENSEDHQHYVILLIFTNGLLQDYQSTVDEIIAANNAPLSIIFVGIGDNDFTTLENLDADKKELISSDRVRSKRDIV